MQKGEKMKCKSKGDYYDIAVTRKNIITQLRCDVKERDRLLSLCWDAIQEAGYEDHSKELSDYFNK